jgi:hypothetical protein
MNARSVRLLFVAFFVLCTIATTYPGLLLVNRIRPFIFGLPFGMAWITFWIVLAFTVFLVANAAIEREQAHSADAEKH